MPCGDASTGQDGSDSHRARPSAGGQPRGDADPADGSGGGRRHESPPPSPAATRTATTTGQAATTAPTPATAMMMPAGTAAPTRPNGSTNARGSREDDDHHDGTGPPAGPPAPFPALINLTVPAGTAYGWSSAPGEACGWGLTDADETRRLLQAASMHPRTRWCFTLLGPDGTAAAHGCARGQHPWIPPPSGVGTKPRWARRPAGRGARRLLALKLNVTFTPIAKGQLRPRQRPRTAIRPAASSGTSIRRPHRDPAPRPAAAPTRAPQRPRPHRRLPRRADRRMQHRPALPQTPSRQTSPRLEARSSPNPAS